MRDEAVGPAGPTTATRMDKFTRQMLEPRPACWAWSARRNADPRPSTPSATIEAVYLMAVGGAAYLVSKAIKSSQVLAFEDLGMEAIYEFDVEDMPVTVAVDSQGSSVHQTGPREWQARIRSELGGVPILA